jgi:hypothetical protein
MRLKIEEELRSACNQEQSLKNNLATKSEENILVAEKLSCAQNELEMAKVKLQILSDDAKVSARTESCPSTPSYDHYLNLHIQSLEGQLEMEVQRKQMTEAKLRVVEKERNDLKEALKTNDQSWSSLEEEHQNDQYQASEKLINLRNMHARIVEELQTTREEVDGLTMHLARKSEEARIAAEKLSLIKNKLLETNSKLELTSESLRQREYQLKEDTSNKSEELDRTREELQKTRDMAESAQMEANGLKASLEKEQAKVAEYEEKCKLAGNFVDDANKVMNEATVKLAEAHALEMRRTQLLKAAAADECGTAEAEDSYNTDIELYSDDEEDNYVPKVAQKKNPATNKPVKKQSGRNPGGKGRRKKRFFCPSCGKYLLFKHRYV